MGAVVRIMAAAVVGGWHCSKAWNRLGQVTTMVDTYRVLGRLNKSQVLGAELGKSTSTDYGHFSSARPLRPRQLRQQKLRRFPKYSTTNSDYGRFYAIKGAILNRTLPIMTRIHATENRQFFVQ